MGVLRDRMIEEMKLRNFSVATQESYVYAVSRLARYHNKSPDQLSKEDIRAFLVHLTIERKLSPNSAGPRVSELVNLKITDIDAQRMTLRVKQRKGGKDRYAILSQKVWRVSVKKKN
jgi:site-specific recombinase XerD